MTCIKCGGRLAVWLTREISRGIIRRRRKCIQCDHRKVTIELSEQSVNILLAKAGLQRREPIPKPRETAR